MTLCKKCGQEKTEAGPFMVCRSCVQANRSATPAPRTPRPGTELKAILSDWLGIQQTKQCGCRSIESRMNSRGVSWCQSDAGMAEILDGMRQEHAKRKMLLPWSDVAARTLVRIACARATSKA